MTLLAENADARDISGCADRGQVAAEGRAAEQTIVHDLRVDAEVDGNDRDDGEHAYYETFNLPVNITRCSNNYGPYQFPEKLIPLMISNALEDKKLPIYGDGKNIRDWLHVYDHCTAIDLVLHDGKLGEVYNIGGHNERQNIQIVKLILEALGKTESLIEFVDDRLGHDRRYAIDSTKIRENLGWEPKYTFETGIKETIQWYLDNQDWMDQVKSGEYQEYYKKMYLK